MKITALEEYGLRCMTQLARLDENQAITLPEISKLENLSHPYAVKVMALLRKGGLVSAERGRNGGYTLTRQPSNIFLDEIFIVLGEQAFGNHHCIRYSDDDDDCIHHSNCSVRDVWITMGGFINQFLKSVTLADLVDGQVSRRNFVESLREVG